jgi:DNA-binding beta-propeller fold protein YncE
VNTCNGTDHTSCSQTPSTLSVEAGPDGPSGIAVDRATDTVYVASYGVNNLAVFNGATCNAATHSGCGQTPPTVAAGPNPNEIAINQRTNTIYVADDYFDADPTGNVSVIDGTTCNATHAAGCGQTSKDLTTTGGFLNGIIIDQHTDTVYVSSVVDSAVNVFRGASCDATRGSGCGQTPATIPAGGWPAGLAVNRATGTIYVSDNVDGQTSVFATTRGHRHHGASRRSLGRTTS